MEFDAKTIARKNLPSRAPLTLTIAIYLLLDKLHASEIAWGIVGTVMVVWWISWIILLFREKSYDLFDYIDVG